MINQISLINQIKNNYQLILIFSLLFLIFNNIFETKSILIIILIFIIYYFYNLSQDNNLINIENKHKINNNNKNIKTNIYFDDETNNILNELKIYKKYNKKSYKNGIKNLKMYFFIIKELENDEINHFKDKYENAELYLKTSLNEFQSLNFSVPNESYLNIIKNNDFVDHNENIGNLCKKLHNHCHHLLLNLSIKLNKNYNNNPTNYNSYIFKDNILQSNNFNQYDFY